MVLTRVSAVLLLAGLALGACSSDPEPLWPVASNAPGGTAGRINAAPLSPPIASPAPAPGTPTGVTAPAVVSASIPAGASSNTFVGQKVAAMRGDFGRMQGMQTEHSSQFQAIRSEVRQAGERYYATIGQVSARLQTGTTPGNPLVTQQWNSAQSELDRLADGVGRLNNLSSAVAANASLAAFLLDQTRSSYSISGALDEDHRALAALEDEINRSTVSIDRLMAELSDEVSRQNGYVSAERRNMTALAVAIKSGQFFGSSLSTRSFNPGVNTPMSPTSAPNLAGRRPLAVIKFDRPNVPYQQQLFSAVSQAVERRPDVTFDLVAVAPNRDGAGQAGLASTQARRNAEAVYRSLTEMGLPADRVALSAITSNATDVNEVHLYVR
jgi:hypothetical protein